MLLQGSRMQLDSSSGAGTEHLPQPLWLTCDRSLALQMLQGSWVRLDSGIGAGADSYYEYLLKVGQHCSYSTTDHNLIEHQPQMFVPRASASGFGS